MLREKELERFKELMGYSGHKFEQIKGSLFNFENFGKIWIEPIEKYNADESIAVPLSRVKKAKEYDVKYYGAFVVNNLYIKSVDSILNNKDKFNKVKYDEVSLQIPLKFFILFTKDYKMVKANLSYAKNKKHNKVIWLHVHDEYSNRDGVGKNREFVLKAKSMGQNALALTNHGNMAGSLNHYINCKELNIKAIFGQEFYINDDMYRKGFTEEEINKMTNGLKTKKEKDTLISEKEKEANFRKYWHITILAKNEIGYKNLIKLSSIGWLEGFYYKPRIDYKTLFEYKEGLIILSGCTASKLAELTKDNWRNGINYILEMQEQFKDDFYFEVMLINYKPQIKLNEAVYYLSSKLKVKIVLTNDIHYVNKENFVVQDMYRKMMRKEKNSELSMECNDLYFKTIDDLHNSWKSLYSDIKWDFYENAIENTLEVSNKIEDINIELGKYILPKIEKEGGNEYYFKKRIKIGWKKYLGWLNDNPELKLKYKKQLKKEYKVIKNNGYIDYFLVVLDVMDYVKKDCKKLAWARGSAAGSLISYLLDITMPDPIKHNLLFERFINASRTGEEDVGYKSLPDIDCDFDDRNIVVNYLISKYEKDKCCPIGSYDRIKVKSGIKMFGKVESDEGKEGWNFEELNRITRFMPEIENIEEVLNNDKYKRDEWFYEFQKWYKVNKDWYKSVVEPVLECPAWNSKHPAGVVITPKNLIEYVPLKIQDFKNENEEQQTTVRTIVTQWEDKFLEKRGLLKIDILGLRTLKHLEEMIKAVKKLYNKDVDLKTMSNDVNDDKIIKYFKQANTTGIFQMDTYHGKKGLIAMQPKSFNDLVALNALLRPGTSSAGTDRIYFDRMNGYEKVKYDHKLLEPVLKDTYGIMLYQEQITQIAHVVGGLSLSDADKFRTAIKKFDSKAMLKFKPQFIEGAVKKGCLKVEAEKIYNLVHAFSGYGFNKNHSCAYTLYSYFLMWFKVYYPLVFYIVLLNYPKSKEQFKEIVEDIKKRDIKLKMTNINLSKEQAYIKNDCIVWGLNGLKYVGDKVIPEIVKSQPYESISDFVVRGGKATNKRVLESLLKAGAFDCFSKNRIEQTEELFKAKKIIIPKEFSNYKSNLFWINARKEIYGF